MMLFIFVTLCLGRVASEETLFPNERVSLDDCHLRFRVQKPIEKSNQVFGVATGEPAIPNEFPHMAAIGWIKSDGAIQWRCGGSLVWYNFVLTAAHCGQLLEGKPPEVVRLGDIDFNSDTAQQFRIVQIIKHPEFKGKSRYHDIALLKLDRNVDVNPSVIPACLWTDAEVRFPKLIATGWGRTGEGEEFSPNLLKGSLRPISNLECSQYYTYDQKIKQGLIEQQLCAVDEKMDTCEGDSGGPLLVKLTHNRQQSPFIVGITSFGSTCGVSIPGVYTRVSSYFKWIIDTMRQNGAPSLEADYNETYCALKFAPDREYYQSPIYDIDNPEVLVQIQWQTQGRSDCYGVIVDEDAVLTVADCTTFKGNSPSHIIYRKNMVMPISEIIIHPSYTKGAAGNNIAILKLKNRMNLPFPPSCISEYIEQTYLNVIMYGIGRTDINSYVTTLNPRQSIKVFRTSLINANSCIIPDHFRSLLHNELASDHLCFGNTDYLVPKSCEQLTGSMIGFYDGEIFRTSALSLYSRDCGFGEHLIGTNLGHHIDWLKTVLLPGFRDSSAVQYVDADLQEGDECMLGSGRTGRCVPLEMCSEQLMQSEGQITFCSSASTVCCSSQNIDIRSLIHPDILNCPNLIKTDPKINIVGFGVIIKLIDGDKDFACLGSIINRFFVVTVASCLQNVQPQLVILVSSGVELDVISTIQHSKFNNTDRTYDIALIKLKNPLTWNNDIGPICLWTNLTHTPLELRPTELTKKKGEVLLHPRYNSDCQRAHPFILKDSQLCTSIPYESTDTAPGGQLYYADVQNKIIYLVGLSTEQSSPENKQYSLFTRISSFLEWISEHAF